MNRIYTCIIESGSKIIARDMLLPPDSGPAIEEARRKSNGRLLCLLPGCHEKNVMIPEPVSNPQPQTAWGQMPENMPPGF